MRNSENDNFSGETQLDKQYKSIIGMFDRQKSSLEQDFVGAKKYNEQEVLQDIYSIQSKKRGFDKRNGEISALDDDKALEGILYYMGQNDQLFTADTFSEPGSDYDDYFNGIDVIFGINKDNGELPTIFSIDATSATTRGEVAGKFADIDRAAKKDSPGCNQIKYYKHENYRGRLSCKPNYIVGASPAAISRAAERFEIHEEYSICYETDPDFRKKILIEILLQAQAGIRACKLVKNRTDFTERAEQAHKEVNELCKDSLYKLFNIDKNGENALKEFNSTIKESIKKYAYEDNTFTSIYNEAEGRRSEYGNRLNGNKVNKVNKINKIPA